MGDREPPSSGMPLARHGPSVIRPLPWRRSPMEAAISSCSAAIHPATVRHDDGAKEL
jgi:hypothetical protein